MNDCGIVSTTHIKLAISKIISSSHFQCRNVVIERWQAIAHIFALYSCFAHRSTIIFAYMTAMWPISVPDHIMPSFVLHKLVRQVLISCFTSQRRFTVIHLHANRPPFRSGAPSGPCHSGSRSRFALHQRLVNVAQMFIRNIGWWSSGQWGNSLSPGGGMTHTVCSRTWLIITKLGPNGREQQRV